MRPIEVDKLIEDRFNAEIHRPIHLESEPGTGKTQIPRQVASRMKIGFIAIHAPLMQPEDYGFPVISADRSNVTFIVSKDKFPVTGSTCPETGILLIDELSQADNAGQKILANLVQEREIHGQKLKPGWMIITTGNRTKDRAGANRILSHLGNRITRVTLDPSLDDWCNWAFENGIKTEVIQFLRFRPDLLSAFNPQHDSNPTPRAWSEGVSASLGVVAPASEFAVFTGDVGEGPASEFMSFLKIYRNLPSIDAILLNPKKHPVPKDANIRFAICGALANKATGDKFEILMEFMVRMPPEFTVLFVKDVLRRHKEIETHPIFIRWASTDGAKLLT